MRLSDAIIKRRSIRKFSNKKVRFGDVIEAIDAAIQAPRAGNVQTMRFIVIEKPSMKARLAECAQQDWLAEAPVIVVVCSEPQKLEGLYHDRADKYLKEQTGAAIQNFLLRLTELKLGSCWVGAFTDYYIKKDLGIPEDVEISAILPIGYPSNQRVNAPRKIPLENVLRWDNWKKKFKTRRK